MISRIGKPLRLFQGAKVSVLEVGEIEEFLIESCRIEDQPVIKSSAAADFA